MKRNTQRIEELLEDGASVYSATFVFRVRKTDEEFEWLNDLIDEAANSNPGYLGKEGWENCDEDKRSVVYYWANKESLKRFSKATVHQKAKQKYKQWYEGYEVMISEVQKLKLDYGL